MNNSGIQRIVPIILVIIIIAVAVTALISVGRNIFGGSSSSPEQTNEGKDALLNTAQDRSVRMTVRGPIVGDEKFYTYTITSSPTSRNLTTYQGYLENQIDTSQPPNTTKGYEEFVHALDRQGLMDPPELTGDANDTRGICATGTLYVYEVLQASNVVKSLWTTTCANSKGSLKTSNTIALRLFRNQISNTPQLTSKLSL